MCLVFPFNNGAVYKRSNTNFRMRKKKKRKIQEVLLNTTGMTLWNLNNNSQTDIQLDRKTVRNQFLNHICPTVCYNVYTMCI